MHLKHPRSLSNAASSALEEVRLAFHAIGAEPGQANAPWQKYARGMPPRCPSRPAAQNLLPGQLCCLSFDAGRRTRT